jgi:hypothetical protein
MSPEVIGLLGAVVGAVAGLGGGLTVQIMQNRAQRRMRIANLGAQLASASYVVSHSARRTKTAGKDLHTTEFLELPAFREAVMAASELAIIAPEEVATRATALANTMTSSINQAGKEPTTEEWSEILKNLRDERNAFIKSMRDSKLQLVVQVGLRAAANPIVDLVLPFR